MNELKKFSSSEFGELNIMFIDGKEYFLQLSVRKYWDMQIPEMQFKKDVEKMGSQNATSSTALAGNSK